MWLNSYLELNRQVERNTQYVQYVPLYTCTCIVLVNTHTTIKQSFLITASNAGTIHRNFETCFNFEQL